MFAFREREKRMELHDLQHCTMNALLQYIQFTQQFRLSHFFEYMSPFFFLHKGFYLIAQYVFYYTLNIFCSMKKLVLA
jgi:hypothetical protein